ncbi:MAG TPA: hypothetical protein VMV56_07500 [Williamwhitmania sp.]|nr:hypothetical protein [Williamwhitmania sp.]
MEEKKNTAVKKIDGEDLVDNQIMKKIESAGSGVIEFQNASLLTITEDEKKILLRNINENDINIRPDGIVYLPQVFYRDVLNKAFGHGQWVIIQQSTKIENNRVFYIGSLYIRGCFISQAIGEAEYFPSNPKSSWGTAYEGAKSDCVTRCCKDLGIAKKLWQPRFIEKWTDRNAVKVWRNKTSKRGSDKPSCYQWRHKNAKPFWDESLSNIKEHNEPIKVSITKEQRKRAILLHEFFINKAGSIKGADVILDAHTFELFGVAIKKFNDLTGKQIDDLYKHLEFKINEFVRLSKKNLDSDALPIIPNDNDLVDVGDNTELPFK